MLAESARTGLLAAMGIEVWQLRNKGPAQQRTDDASAHASGSQANSTATASTMHVIVVCADKVRRAAQHKRFFDGLARTLGIDAPSFGWLEAGADGSLAAPDSAPAYIILGEALTRHFGAHLSTQRQSEVTIAVCAEPDGAMRDASSKRLFWQTLKPLARRLRGVMA